MQNFLLTAPVPYRHHLPLLASNPGIKKETGKGGAGRWCGTVKRRIKRGTEVRFMSL